MPVRDAGRRRRDGGRTLYTAMGFEPIGTFRRIGHKHGQWHDVLWSQRALGPYDDEPAFPV